MPKQPARSVLCPLALVAVLSLGSPPAHAAPRADCSGTSTGMVPLADLGAGTYQGFNGGLYPGGANVPPPSHLALARSAAAAIAPRDAAGSPAAEGRVVLLSLGMSNATQEFSTFVQQARGEGSLHPRLAIVDGAQGGQTAAVIRDPAANFWTVVDQRLRAAGATAAQVQAIWLKEANARPTAAFPAHAEAMTDDLQAVIGIVHQRFANLQLVYLASRTYAGYASTNLNPEPFAYEGAFSMRWLIERQIAGTGGLNADPARGPVTAPVLLWGPYLWADGLTPRSDGFLWRCEDFVDDGTHPSASGRQKVANLLMRFFKEDETSRSWFLANAPTPTPGATATPTRTPPPATATPAARLWLPLSLSPPVRATSRASTPPAGRTH
jgi:hypothetical protein